MKATALTVGSFDGVHCGHQAVLAELARVAREQKLESAVITFEPHPLEVVNPTAAPRLLTLPDERLELLRAAGAQVTVLPFTPELASLGPEEFTRDVLLARFGAKHLVVGYDHGFGRERSGDTALLRRLGSEAGFGVTEVDAVRDAEQPISSTRVRTAIAHGDLAPAARWLGRPYSLRGVVMRGEGRGRGIGIPTINLAAPDARKLLPPDGVYAARVVWRGTRYDAMMNQGPRPTFGVAERGLEAHLFDFEGDLYGETVTVEWVRRLRDVQRFPSRDALVAQLARDARAARDSLKR